MAAFPPQILLRMAPSDGVLRGPATLIAFRCIPWSAHPSQLAPSGALPRSTLVDTFKKLLPILPLVLLFGAAFQSSNSVPAQLTAILTKLDNVETQLAALAAKGQRQFYLTQSTHDGAHALSACAMGYHMASIWEIHDMSNLRYNTELGLTQDDSGFGPPSGFSGWIRTGSIANNPPTAGFGNCQSWTSSSVADYGSF